MIDNQIPEKMKAIREARIAGHQKLVRELGLDLIDSFPLSEPVVISDADLLTIPPDIREEVFRRAVLILVNQAKTLVPAQEPPAHLKAVERELLRYADANSILLSLLYDLNLLPEVIISQAEAKRFRNKDWAHMLLIIAHFKQLQEGYKIASEMDNPEKQELRRQITELGIKIQQAEPYTLDDPEGKLRAEITQWEKELAELKLKLLS